jgi:hypothetical protein
MSQTNRQRYAEFDPREWDKIMFNEATDSYIVVHRKHGFHERASNLWIARRLIALGYSVELLPNIEHVKSFDAYMNGEGWEFKTTNGSRASIQGRLREGKNQCDKILLVLPTEFILHDVIRGVYSAVGMDKEGKISEVGLLFETKFVILTKQEITRKNLEELVIFLEDNTL